MLGLIVLLVLAAIGTGLYSLSRHNGSGSASPSTSASGHSSSPAANTVLTPVNATVSIETTAAQARGDCHNPGECLAHAVLPDNPVFGGLKNGSGLLLDMGKSVTLSSIQLTFGPTAGTNVTIEIGNTSPGSHPGPSFTKSPRRRTPAGYSDVPDQARRPAATC